jgi:hypothetical protein
VVASHRHSGFLAILAYVVGHDDPTPGLSHRGLFTVALTAVVVVLLTIHRRYGSRSLARALTEYTAVALLATLLAAAGGPTVDQPPADRPTRAVTPAQAAAGDDQPAAIRAGAKVIRAVTGAARAVASAIRWLIDLWHQADQQTTPPQEAAMAAWPRSPTALPASSVLSTWRCL